ncbi:MAG: zinc-binding dehydrogenase [Alphaproteobacteria bacterium]|nr:zinc-binding dehydrogenase [Alphaproteobacteria bacterium]MBL6937028.1 zinc-binding dehydrogenase [Alphaproteobacteria bacterium]MBL7097797.1 zinc-binding dehydrogenase [Alphaproteobacteria bacterium]
MTAPANLGSTIAPVVSALPDLIKIAGGDPHHVITCGDFQNASALGVRTGLGEEATGPGGTQTRWDVLGEFAQLAGEGRFAVPIASTYPPEKWREALDISLSGRAHGKLVILPEAPAATTRDGSNDPHL